MSLISVIVPVYRVEPYLRRCIDSILRQTLSDFELILVDDGSPDGCPQICEAYAQADARVRVIHKTNGGLSDARNAGLAVAGGEYIVFVDSDDWVSERYLETLFKAIQSTGSDICECAAAVVSDERTAVVSSAARESRVYRAQEALRLLIQDSVLHQYVWNKMYRKSCVDGILFETGRTNEDEFWTYQVFGRASGVTKIEDTLYFYYQRQDSIMGVGYSIRRLDALEAKSRRQKYVEEHFPMLAEEAQINLFASCIYSGQMTLRYLPRDDKRRARAVIDRMIEENNLRAAGTANLTGGAKLWIILAKWSFWGTCRLKNLLGRGF